MKYYIQAFISSFYSRRFYYELARTWQGAGFSLLFMLALLVTMGISLIMIVEVFTSEKLHSLIEATPQFVDTLPAAKIVGGKLSIDKPSPYYIPLGKHGEAGTIIIDTNYQAPSLGALETYMALNHAAVMITADNFITFNKEKLEAHNFAELKRDVTITHENWHTFGTKIIEWGQPVMLLCIVAILFVCILPILFLGWIISSFFSAIAVKIVGWIWQAHLDFSACMRLASGFRIPVTVIGFVFTVIPTSAIVGWLIWGGYIIFAVWSSKHEPVAT